MGIKIEIADQVDGPLIDAFARLIPQLSSSSPPPDAQALAQIIADPTSWLLLARDDEQSDGPILGSLTLVSYRMPTGVKAWIEDVVVDEQARGRGVGAALNEFAIEQARSIGAKNVNLTSRPSREPANRLYQRLGFEQYPTNVYRFTL